MKTKKFIKLFSLATLVFLSCFTGNTRGEGSFPDSLCICCKNRPCGQSIVCTDNQKAFSFYMAGIKFDSDSDYESAIIEFNKAIKFDKNFAEAYDKRGVAYTKMIMFGKAIKDFSKAIELRNNFTEAYNHRGIVYYCMSDYYNALSDYSKALSLDPNYAKAYYNRGIVKLSINDDSGAIADFRVASDMKFEKATDYLANNSVVMKY